MYSIQEVDLSNTDFFEQPEIPKISEASKESMEGAITLEECTSIIKTFALNKSPLNDSLPNKFYFTFWTEIGNV